MFINGRRVQTNHTYPNVDPSTGLEIGQIARGRAKDIDEAVSAARAVQESWAKVKPEHRSNLLEAIADKILYHQEELALLESQDTGKPLKQARTDTIVAARYFRFYGRAIDTYYGLSLPTDPEFHVYTVREPLGICGSIIAWNYPLQLFSRAVAPALATGNAIVLKPADETPRTAIRVAEIASETGLPPGLLNVVPGIGIEAGAALAEHPDLDHIAFVGSTDVGRSIAKAAAENIVPATLELGGKSPHIVFPDADLGSAARFIVHGIIQNAGQTCSAGSRVLVHEDVADELNDKLTSELSHLTIGPGIADPDIGPLISRKQQQRVLTMLDDAEGEVVSVGTLPQEASSGTYVKPTIVKNIDPKSTLAQEEVFGPVLAVMSFSTEEEAVEIANDSKYALMAAVWTKNVSRAHRLATQVTAGQVYVNAFGAGGGVEYPFGGSKHSGYGREKGRESLDTYTQTKTVLVKV